jgi:hypothetical protein
MVRVSRWYKLHRLDIAACVQFFIGGAALGHQLVRVTVSECSSETDSDLA